MFETLGQYKILDRIGAGGMGEVYRARDTRLGRTVAIKVLASGVAGDQKRRDRFLLEARATAALSHPNISALYEIGEDQGQLFLVFEFVPGETLKTAIAGRPLNLRRALDLAVQAADALADAHASGIVHRDIKPDNIIVTPKGNAKILDCGLATWTTGGAEREHAATLMATGAGTTLGTVAYMSPEQALGEEVDERTDIFSLGIVLFEMLTGTLPFTGTTSTALALQIVQAPAPVPSSVNPSVPRELDVIVARALSKSIDQRYESAATMAAELRSVIAILDVRSSMNERAASPVAILPPRRSYAVWIVLAVLLAGAAAGAWVEREPIRRQWRRTFGPAPSPVIAVIPLKPADNDPSQMYFADGLTEDLISRLGQTPGLKVLGRSSTRGYKNRTPREVAAELGAGIVLTGSVRPAGDTVKVSLELINPHDGTAIWSNQYTRELKDIFKVQAQVAEEVATALRVTLQPTAASARAASRLVDPRAYEQYLRARQAMNERRLPAAIDLYQAAIALDEGLADAYAGLAAALYFDSVFDRDVRAPQHVAQVRAAAERAYELDPDLPQANTAMGLVADTLKGALQYMRHAVDVDPSYGDGYHLIADQIADFDTPFAISFWRRALAVDPRFEMTHVDLEIALVKENRWDEARREAALVHNEALQDLNKATGAFIDLDQHRFDTAIRALESHPALRTTERRWAAYVNALATAGRNNDAAREAVGALGRFRDSCAIRSALAGLRHRGGQLAAARELAAPLLQAAIGESASSAAVRCAVTAAAALHDGPKVAAFLDRISAREDHLRYWALAINGNTGAMELRGRLFPFADIVDDPAVAAAKSRLEAAYARERDVAHSVLSGLP